MAHPGFISGFIVVRIDRTICQILDSIGIVLRCKKELGNLKDLIMEIEPIIKDIQQYRLELSKKKSFNHQGDSKGASAVNSWLKKLDALLQESSTIVHQCTQPSYDVILRYKTSRRITCMISDITQHLQLAPLVGFAQNEGQTQELLEELGQIRESVQDLASSSASTSATTSQSGIASTGFFISEPLIVGQENALAMLENFVISEAADTPFLRIGVVGKGGSGKTLLLKTLFNSKMVRDLFSDRLLLWLTVSQFPSFISLCNELSAQVAMQTEVERNKNMNHEALRVWLNERMQGKRFLLILDDVWEEGEKLLQELGLLCRLTDSSISTVIVSSRNRRALLKMGVAEKYIITMEDLNADDSWQLFAYHAFPFITLPNIHEGTAKIVCAKCGGLPLAIKAVGRAMAGVTSEYEWQLAARRLPTATRQDKEALYHRLRLSYDALGRYDINLQLCFLYLATFLEDYIVQENEAIPLWVSEGLLTTEKLQDQRGDDPFQKGRNYVNILADRCLIEPIGRDVDGRVLWFRLHDVLRDLAVQIAEQEENFYCGAGRVLTTLKENECSGRTRILLNSNKLTSLPQSLSSPEICSLIVGNNNIIEIPRRLIRGMISLKVLDLSWTCLQSLPESVGCLKQLVYLSLAHVRMTRLPASLTNLLNLEILILFGSGITELPSAIHKLRSLKYLDLNDCDDLRCLPYNVSGLTSLQYLYMSNCRSLWRKHQAKHSCTRAASIDDLGRLTQLKGLYLENNGQAISQGTLGNLANMETLELTLTKMAGPPHDLKNMSKLKRLMLNCRLVVKMDFLGFQNLVHLRLWELHSLEDLPPLHKLMNLRKLDIVRCGLKLEKYPKEFSDIGAFPSLEILSLVELPGLQELPIVEEGAMPCLQIFTMMRCPALKWMPVSYLSIKTLQKIRVYECPMVLENLEKDKIANTKIEVVTTSRVNIDNVYKKLDIFENSQGSQDSWVYDKFWCNELYLFLQTVGFMINFGVMNFISFSKLFGDDYKV